MSDSISKNNSSGMQIISFANTKKKIASALKDAVAMRNGSMTAETMNLYCTRLAREPLEDVLMTLEKLGESPRGEYESAIPEIGALLAVVSTCTIARENRLKVARAKRLVRWQCPECRVTCAGWMEPSASLDKRCQGLPKSGQRGLGSEDKPICGGRLNVVYDEMDYPREMA